MTFPFSDLRDFLEEADRIGFVKRIDDANCEYEIGAISDLLGARADAPLLLFDKIPGYPKGFRIVANWSTSSKLCALALGMDPILPNLELIKLYRRKAASLRLTPPRHVNDGPVLENTVENEDVDLTRFPVPNWHVHDGGKYIGTSDLTISRDPDGNWVNLGNYRMMVHDRNTLGVWFASPRRHAYLIAEKYWSTGKSCPVAVSFGHDPTISLASVRNLPFGVPEYDYAGGLRERALEVISGKLTGLPIPATSEIAIEGEIPPPKEETRMEGPFCEYPGYYAHRGPELVIRVKRLMHRNNPILLSTPNPKPPYAALGLPYMAADLWEYLERANIPSIHGVWTFGSTFLIVISLKQRFAGQAKQALLSTSSFLGGGPERFVVTVDDDIDPSNISEVLWALLTRTDPSTSIDIVKRTWTTGLDPRLPPSKRDSGDFTMSICLIDACKPFEWADKFPDSQTVDPAALDKVTKKWADLFKK